MARNLSLCLVFLWETVGCAQGEGDYYTIRRAVIREMLGQVGAVDDLIIRLAPQELRENLNFAGETIFLIGETREEEYWKVRDPSRTYLFLKDISLSEDKNTATIEIELYLGDAQYQREVLALERSEGGWKVIWRRSLAGVSE